MNDSNDTIIEASSLGRTYRTRVKAEGLGASLKGLLRPTMRETVALSGFDLALRRGELLGLVGPNGAGKTTLVKLLSGLMAPSAGSLRVLGHEPSRRRESFLSRIALVMGQKSQLWWDLPALDSFALAKAIYGIPEARYRGELARLSAALEAGSFLEKPVRSLSLGERMKVELIAALLHGPELLFLDEPTIGLDAPSQKALRDFLKRENEERGISLVLTSHYMEDITSLCPRCVLVVAGRKRYDGGTEAMLAGARARKLLRASLAPGEPGPDPAGPPPDLPGELLESGPGGFALGLRPDQVGEAIAAVGRRYHVLDLAIEEEELGETVSRLYAEGARDAR
jgi:ABC-2 type transport system ATP-binding protein